MFPPTKSTTSGGTAPASAVKCSATLLAGFTLPARLARVGTGDVSAGATAVYKCSGSDDVLFESGTNAFVAGQQVVLTCNADGSAFTGIPTNWPTCTAATAKCAAATPDAGKGFTALAGGTEAAVGASLTYTCADAAHVVSGTTANTFVVACKASALAASPFYEAKLETEAANFPSCGPAARRKRAAALSGYNYILVDLETQFINDTEPPQADFQAWLDGLGGFNGSVGAILIDPNCTSPPCGINSNIHLK